MLLLTLYIHKVFFVCFPVTGTRIWCRAFSCCKQPTMAVRTIPSFLSSIFVSSTIWALREVFVQSLSTGKGLSLLQVLSNPFSSLLRDSLALSPVMSHLRLVWLSLLNIFLSLLHSFVNAVSSWFHVDLEAIESGCEWASDRLVPHGTVRGDDLTLLDLCRRWVFSQWPLERFLIAAELLRTFLDSETSVIAEDVGVSACAVLAIDDHMGLHVVAHSLVDAHGVEAAWVPSDIGSWWLELRRGLVPDREASVIVRNVFITIVSALPKAFLKAVALVDEDRFEVPGAVHGASVDSRILQESG